MRWPALSSASTGRYPTSWRTSGSTEDALRLLQDEYPIAPRGLNRQALMDRAVVHVVDMLNDPRVANLGVARTFGHRSQLVVPMLQTRRAIGTIVVYGAEPVPFSDAQITLLQTFADQAVIAIENTRLFEEVQASKRELSRIARIPDGDQRGAQRHQSLADRRATRLRHDCAELPRGFAMRRSCNVFRFDGELVHFAASHGTSTRGRSRPTAASSIEPDRAGYAAAAPILSDAVMHIPDIHADPDYRMSVMHSARRLAQHSWLFRCCKDGHPDRGYRSGATEPGHFPRAANRAAQDLRRPSRDRHREHAAVRGRAGEQARAPGIARVPDRDKRSAQRHQSLTDRASAGPGRDCCDSRTPMRIYGRHSLACCWREGQGGCPIWVANQFLRPAVDEGERHRTCNR